ncbi:MULTISPECIES: DUF5719 family protein [unclassified Microbacterium]|uniref:DUF5719 family protein n=1 Tax=unclassified Microbacterium TaxID=2609290 RepID=UPI00160503D0|nr:MULTISPECIES: DUF5719 family protein [unclassified Microbacterium]QNA92298.1 hypothetical protein G4G29_07680 [Microbacterium sp. Se63.02b]QYM65570.1 hypothetical protein K1X59_07735 [Microbacterium sp. Se5.02b]
MSGSRAFRVAATGARVVTGLVVIAACVVGVTAAVHAPWPIIGHDPAQVEVTPLPGDNIVVCNGDMRALGRDAADPLSMVSAGRPGITIGGTSGDPSSEQLAVPDLPGAGEVSVFTGAVEGRSAPLIAASESATLAADDLAGYAAAACGTPRLDSWLVGGSTDTGTEDIVILTNAAEVPSTVTLTVYGETRGTRTVVVPARTQAALPLTSVAAGTAAPVVRVEAAGAPVRAVLQSSLVQVLDPAGIDLQDAVPGPQQRLVLSGVQVFAANGDDAEMAVLRVLSPGADARVQVRVTPEGSSSAVDEFTVPLEPDMPAQVSLSGLEPGAYTVDVVADAPVVAALRQQDGFGQGSDFAWITPAQEIDDDVLFAVPAGPSPRVQVVNASDQDATVTLEALDSGQPEEVTVAAGQSVGLEVSARETYLLRATGPVHAAVTLTGPGALAVLPLQANAGVEKAIAVYP